MVDASVALQWFLPEISSAAESLLQSFLASKLNPYAPDLLLIETASALWRRSIVRGDITVDDARAIYRDLLTLPLNFLPSNRMAANAFSLALIHRHSAYDALYCALAIEMDCEFITADRNLLSKLEKSLPFIRHISALTL